MANAKEQTESKDDVKKDQQEAPGTSPGGDVLAEGGLNGAPARQPQRKDEPAPPAGEGSDLRVDSDVAPKDKDAPRPTV